MGSARASRAYLPVFLTLLISLPLVYIVYASEMFIQATVFTEEGGGAQAASAGIMNALILLISALVGGSVIYLLFKMRKEHALGLVFTLAFIFVLTVISVYFMATATRIIYRPWYPYYLAASPLGPWMRAANLYYTLPSTVLSALSLVLSLLFALYITFRVFRTRWVRESNVALIVMASMTGAFLAVLLPLYTAVFLLILLSVYDIYSVFKGPIRRIAEMSGSGKEWEGTGNIAVGGSEESNPHLTSGIDNADDRNKGDKVDKGYTPAETFDETIEDEDLMNRLTYKTPFWDLGLGDLVFYSALTSIAFIFGARNFAHWGILAPWVPFFAVAMAVMIGLYITIKLLERNYLLPGLPMSVFLGLCALGVTYLSYLSL